MTQTYEGGCHCGRVRFRVTADLSRVTECNCSVCAKKGFLHLIVPPEQFNLLQGKDALTTYRFNTGTAQHYFCSKCGIYTYHRRRSNPNQYGVNVACLKDVSPFDFEDVPVIDGINHPSDQGRGYEIVGHLRFVRAEDRPTLAAARPSV